ncbi:hypothetical protein ACG92U_08555 [Leuconostoc citreum]
MSIRFKAITLGIISAFFFQLPLLLMKLWPMLTAIGATPLLYGTYGCCP